MVIERSHLPEGKRIDIAGKRGGMSYKDDIRRGVEIGAHIQLTRRGRETWSSSYGRPGHGPTGKIVDASDHGITVRWDDSGIEEALVRGEVRWAVIDHERAGSGKRRTALGRWLFGSDDPLHRSRLIALKSAEWQPTARERVVDFFGHTIALLLGLGMLISMLYILAGGLGALSDLASDLLDLIGG